MERLTVSDILSVREPADRVPMSLSADGKRAAFALAGKPLAPPIPGVSEAVAGNSQWVCDLETMELIQVAPDAASSWAGVWSPDGKILAFYADIDGKARLWLWHSDGQTLRRVSNTVVSPYFGFERPLWTPDGSRIIVKAMVSSGAPKAYKMDEVSCDSIGVVQLYVTDDLRAARDEKERDSWLKIYLANLMMIDIADGSAVCLFEQAHVRGMAVSPDGRYLAFTDNLGQAAMDTQQFVYDLWVCELTSEKRPPIRIAESLPMNAGFNFAWSLDSESLCCLTPSGELLAIPIRAGDSDRSVLARLGTTGDHDVPYPLPNGDVLTTANGKLWYYEAARSAVFELTAALKRRAVSILRVRDDTALVQTHEPNNDLYGFCEVDLKLTNDRLLVEEARRHRDWLGGGAAACGGRLVYFAESADEPPSLNIYDIHGRQGLGTVSLTAWFKPLGRAEALSWTHAGRTVRGVLLLPPDVKDRVPVVVRVYGGSHQSRLIRTFGLCMGSADNHLIFASRGYAVFLPDMPLARQHEPAAEIAACLEDAMRALVEHPLVDPDRIGIIGHSFGGYSALAGITRLSWFKAAVVSAGIGNLIGYATGFDPEAPGSRTGWAEDGQGDMGGTLWDYRDRYIRNSPLFEFDKIECPVLIVQGMRDRLCRSEAGPMFAALRRLGKTAALALYDEDHWQGTWKPGSLEDYYARVLEWYDRYL